MAEQHAVLARNRRTDAFERRVARVLHAHIEGGAPLVVACSGGPDSTAALLAVARVATGEVTAACFDHGLRDAEETAADRAAVEALAACLGVRCVAGGPPAVPGGRSEDAARVARYGWLAGVCAELGAGYCVTGHTLDDQAETVLLRLTRGSGLRGAAAMAVDAPWPVPPPSEGAPRVLRPLLDRTREEVEGYLDAIALGDAGLAAREDPTNALLHADRNRLRLRVVPELRRINPRAPQALARFAELARRDDAALEGWAEREAEALVTLGEGSARVERAALRALPAAIAARVLRRAAEGCGIRPEAEHLDKALRLAGRRGSRLALPGGDLEVEAEAVWLRAAGGTDCRQRRRSGH